MGSAVIKDGQILTCSSLLLFLLKSGGIVVPLFLGDVGGWVCGLFICISLHTWSELSLKRKLSSHRKTTPNVKISTCVDWNSYLLKKCHISFLSLFNITLPICHCFGCVLCIIVLDQAQSLAVSGLGGCFIDVFSALVHCWEWNFQKTLK